MQKKEFKPKELQKKVFGTSFDEVINFTEFLKRNLVKKIEKGEIKEDKAVKLVIDASIKSLNVYFSQFGIPAYAENTSGFKHLAEKFQESLKEAISSVNPKLTCKLVAIFEGAEEWNEKTKEDAKNCIKVSEFKNISFEHAMEDKQKKPPKSLRREMCIRGLQMAGVETLHADTEVEIKLVKEAKDNCVAVISGETEYLFFGLDSIVPLTISYDEDNLVCTPIYLKSILDNLKFTQEQFKSVGNILSFATLPPKYKFIWGNTDAQDLAISLVQKNMKPEEDAVTFLHRLSEITLDEKEAKSFSEVSSNIKTFCGDKKEKADIFNLSNLTHDTSFSTKALTKLRGYTPELLEEHLKQNSFLDQFHRAQVSNRSVELLLNRHFWWPTILQDEELPQPFSESLAIRKRLYSFLFGTSESVHEEIRIWNNKEKTGEVCYKNESTQADCDFKDKNFFNVWSQKDWKSRIMVLARILLSPEDFAAESTQKLLTESKLSLDTIAYTLMFKAIANCFSFPEWDKATCVKKMLSHSLFALPFKSQAECNSYTEKLFNFLKISSSEINILPNRAVDKRHNPFQTINEDEKRMMIFSFSRLETMVYNVLFVASFLNLPTIFCSDSNSCGIPLVGFNAKMNIQFKPSKAIARSSTNPSSSSSSSSSKPSQQQQKGSSSSSSSSSSSQKGQSQSSGGKSKQPPQQQQQKHYQKQEEPQEEVDEDGFTTVSHKQKNTKSTQSTGWWSGQQKRK